MSITIEQDLKDILGEISHKLDDLQKDVTDLKVGQARLEEKGSRSVLSEQVF
jgi:hypothetical protein